MITAEARFLRGAVAALVLGVWCVCPNACPAQSADDATVPERKADAEEFFRKSVTPFIKTYCLDCHSNRKPTEAGLSFTPALDTPGHAAFSEKWKKAAARVKAHDMPPDGSEQPTDEERQMFIKWLDKLKYLSPKDPGPFVIRRLTKTEYSNTLHDLFGVDRAIAEALPDEVSGEGYLNSLSPLQLEQYLAIAEEVLNKVLAPDDSPPTELQRRLFGAAPTAADDARETARQVAQSLAKKVYRRPATDSELKVLSDVFVAGASDYRNSPLEGSSDTGSLDTGNRRKLIEQSIKHVARIDFGFVPRLRVGLAADRPLSTGGDGKLPSAT